jgi:hypothetical protein
MKIGITYLPGRNRHGVDFEAIKELYSKLFQEGIVGPDYYLEQTNMLDNKYAMYYTPTVVLYDTDSQKEIGRLECNFSIEDLEKLIRQAAKGERINQFRGINQHNLRCFVKKNLLLILAMAIMGILVWKISKK